MRNQEEVFGESNGVYLAVREAFTLVALKETSLFRAPWHQPWNVIQTLQTFDIFFGFLVTQI